MSKTLFKLQQKNLTFFTHHMKYVPGNLRPLGPPRGGLAAAAAAAAILILFNWFIILGLIPPDGANGFIIMGLL